MSRVRIVDLEDSSRLGTGDEQIERAPSLVAVAGPRTLISIPALSLSHGSINLRSTPIGSLTTQNSVFSSALRLNLPFIPPSTIGTISCFVPYLRAMTPFFFCLVSNDAPRLVSRVLAHSPSFIPLVPLARASAKLGLTAYFCTPIQSTLDENCGWQGGTCF